MYLRRICYLKQINHHHVNVGNMGNVKSRDSSDICLAKWYFFILERQEGSLSVLEHIIYVVLEEEESFLDFNRLQIDHPL